MGKFSYEDAVRLDIDDRVLAHLQVVIGTKLRRDEAFFFTWKDDLSLGGGRTTLWIHSHAHLVFRFHGGRAPRLNRTWLDALMFAANSPSGLHLITEPVEDTSREASLQDN